MMNEIRSLNLANSVAVVLYEALPAESLFTDAADRASDKI